MTRVPSDLDTAAIAATPAIPALPLAVGTELGGRYRLVRHVATGGMGQVWAADDLVLGRRVAIKVLKDDLAAQPAFLDRFEREAQHAARITHPNIATLHDYVRDDRRRPPRTFLVMELVEGEPLSAMLRRTPIPPLTTTLRILTQSADALAAAHRNGVVHRDVKPANILLDREGQVKLTDFGIAGPVDDAPEEVRADALGTPHYLSPEQAGGLPVTPASDVYSLGVVAYEMLAGRRPIVGGSPADVVRAHLRDLPAPLPDQVPAEVRNVVLSALAKDPGERPADAATFAARLRSAGESGSLDEPTALMPVPDDEATTVLPIDTSEDVVLVSSSPARSDRRARRGLFWIFALVIGAVTVALTLGTANDAPAPGVPGGTTLPVGSTPDVAAPTAPAPPAEATVPPVKPDKNDAPGNGKAQGNGKAKGG